ncbi:MAG: zinc-ribbon domain-containing protein [Candidatus Thorarchaeota archaeon]
MTTRNPVGYCPNCKQNVLLVREDINWPLAIILLCFTAGIGLVVYLIIYYSQAEDRCIHCHTQIMAKTAQYAPAPALKTSSSQNVYQVPQQNHQDTEKVQIRYCPFCGEPLRDNKAQFCSNCGSKV